MTRFEPGEQVQVQDDPDAGDGGLWLTATVLAIEPYDYVLVELVGGVNAGRRWSLPPRFVRSAPRLFD